ncbi:MAG: TRAP transporter small permease [Geminicoccaceae bacterium]
MRENLHCRLLAIEDRIYRAIMAICLILLGLVVITISAAIFARFIIFTPLNFADPLSKYLLQWMAFLGIGLAARRSEHVLVDMLVARFSGKLRLVLTLVISSLVIIMFAVVFYNGTINALSARTSSDPFVFGVPMIYPYLSVPAGALYAMIQAILAAGISLTTNSSDGNQAANTVLGSGET